MNWVLFICIEEAGFLILMVVFSPLFFLLDFDVIFLEFMMGLYARVESKLFDFALLFIQSLWVVAKIKIKNIWSYNVIFKPAYTVGWFWIEILETFLFTTRLPPKAEPAFCTPTK